MATLQRSSPAVDALRFLTPFVAFTQVSYTQQRSSDFPPSHTKTEQVAGPATTKSRFSKTGYGSRHVSDTAPFTLWDEDRRDFRLPTQKETQWIIETYQANSVLCSWPEIIIETAKPPSPVPLTVACVAATFTPIGTTLSPLLTTDTDYSNPRMEDPVSRHLHWQGKWDRPSREQCEAVFCALRETGASIKAVNFVPPLILVELRVEEGKTYEKRSLPGRVAGQTTIYHHKDEPFWKTANRARERLIDPGDTMQDTTNYAAELSMLCPGVRVESGLTSRQGGYRDATMATTAGVLVRSNSGGQRLTVSNHGFLDSDEVYHPTSRSSGGTCIGRITERWEALDVALVDLCPSTTFTNAEYFQAQPPKRLLRSGEVPNNAWSSLDSMASGLVFLRICGIRLVETRRPPGVAIPCAGFRLENILRCVGPAGGRVRDGICGSAIVVDDDEDGGVIGFFQPGDVRSDWAICPCLDDLIDRGWSLV